MDVDKLKKWLEVAEQFQGNDFWSDIFEENKNRPIKSNPPNQYNQSDNQTQPTPQPFYDLYQTPGEWIVLINLPGVAKEDIELSISGSLINIKGQARLLYHDVNILHSERLNGTFNRTIQLPENVGETKSLAKFQNGLLEIRIPRVKPTEHPINID